MDQESVTVFVVYKNHKKDQDTPGWSVKRWVIDRDGAQPDLMCAYAETLALARALIPMGLTRVPRLGSDDENVFESWV